MQLVNKKNYTSEFLSLFFGQLNKGKVTYCILRNYDTLPEEVGNDVDMWVKKEDIEKFREILLATEKELDWQPIGFLPRLSYHGEGNRFLVKNKKLTTLLHVDLNTIIFWKGVKYINDALLVENRIFHRKGFYIPSPGIEASIKLLKNLLYLTNVQEKYKQTITKHANKDPETFLKSLAKAFGKKEAEFILKTARSGAWGEIEEKINYLRLILIIRALLNKPTVQIKYWIIYLYENIKKYLFSHNGFFIVLLGPDGSGKTTTAKALLNSEMKRFFLNISYFHGHFSFLPRLRKIVGLFKRDGELITSSALKDSEIETKPFNFLRAMIYPLYYGFDYFWGHIFIRKKMARGNLVLFDRYFYDYFIQKPFIKCPKWLLHFISKLIPQPDMLVYLKNQPSVIFERKPELAKREIIRQTVICDEIIKYHTNGIVINTSIKPENVIEEIQNIIINKLLERQKQLCENQ